MDSWLISRVLGISVILLLTTYIVIGARYEPNWDSLDKRPIPGWYDGIKIGIFVHWGVFSVPSFRSEWFWWDWQGAKYNDCVDFMKANYPPDFTYADFAPQFKATFFNATAWADLFDKSGAGYVVLTSKHHEGYTMWPSKSSFNWNSLDVGPKRDLVGELATAIRNQTSMFFGLYHSLFEWFNPLYIQDRKNNWTTNHFVEEKTMPELYDIVNRYKPDYIWSDGDWEASYTYWNSTGFLAWLYNDSPVKETVVTNDRWGIGTLCKHGGVLTCADRFNPGHLQAKKWENAMTLDQKSWGYRRNMNLNDVISTKDLIKTLAQTISFGGNLLINVGPTSDGTIPTVFEERLTDLGKWLKINGEGVYATHPWKYQNDSVTPNVWYTKEKISFMTTVYAIFFDWPKSGYLYLHDPIPGNPGYNNMELLENNQRLNWTVPGPTGINISLANVKPADIKQPWGWVISMYGLTNANATTNATNVNNA